jgi:hypothetical protein
MREATDRGLQEIYPSPKERVSARSMEAAAPESRLRTRFPRGQPDEEAHQERWLKRMKRHEQVQYLDLGANGLSPGRTARYLGF